MMSPVPGEDGSTRSVSIATSTARTSSRDAPKRSGSVLLLEHVHRHARRVFDLGAGDGRLLALLQADRQFRVS